jgi:hypothetical protein
MAKLRDAWSALKRKLGWDQLFSGPSGFFLDPHRQTPASPADPPETALPAPAPASPPAAPPRLEIRVGPPRIVPVVAPLSEEGSADGITYATSFIASWRPLPPPAERWIDLLREAPFGTQAVSARDLRWDGQTISVQRVQEKDIEAYAKMMEEWVDYANREYARWANTPEEMAAFSARERASRLQDRLRK